MATILAVKKLRLFILIETHLSCVLSLFPAPALGRHDTDFGAFPRHHARLGRSVFLDPVAGRTGLALAHGMVMGRGWRGRGLNWRQVWERVHIIPQLLLRELELDNW